MAKDYYKTLGVSRASTSKEIKKAYKRLAMKHHPDRNVDNKDEAEERFKQIQKAYSILSDDEKRDVYDRYGEDGVNATPGFNGFGSGFGGFDDLFGQFFSGQASARQPSDYQYDLDLSFSDAVNGTIVKVRIPTTEDCVDCSGSGAKKGTKPTVCVDCSGTGNINYQKGFFSVSRTCNACLGTGSIIKQKCSTCTGKGTLAKNKTVSVKIPGGVDTGNRIKVTGEGEYISKEYPKGDLYIAITVTDHSFLKRSGLDLTCQVPIRIDTAILGGYVDVPILDGNRRIIVPEGIQTGTVLRVKGEGVSAIQSSKTGDLLCKIVVETPINLSQSQKDLIRDFSKTCTVNHHPESKSFMDKIKSFF